MKSEIDAKAAEWFARRDGGCSPAEKEELESWLHEDVRHAEAFGRLEMAWKTFGKPADTGSTDALLMELAGRRSRRLRRRKLAAFAAAAGLAVGVGLLSRLDLQRSEQASAGAIVHRATERVLPDGSRITLRDGADIGVQFSTGERRVLLVEGEAWFEVAKDRARPFVVSVNGVEVRAVGTSFAVQLNRRSVDVLVTEGTVSVGSSGTNPAVPESVKVTAGNRIVLSNEINAGRAPIEPVSRDEADHQLSWRTPRVEFKGTPLVDAVATMNREAEGKTAWRLRIVDRDLEMMRVSGIFRADNIDAFVLLLEVGFGVKAERDKNVLLLSKDMR